MAIKQDSLLLQSCSPEGSSVSVYEKNGAMTTYVVILPEGSTLQQTKQTVGCIQQELQERARSCSPTVVDGDQVIKVRVSSLGLQASVFLKRILSVTEQ